MKDAGLTDPPLVFVTVGTDHHPFDRLVGWIDSWIASKPAGLVRCRMQTGTSLPPRHVPFRDYLSPAELEAAMKEAAAVVCHGGPATIMMCRGLDKKPIVVPRRADLGEHVDGHQLLFARRMAALGDLELAEEERGLHDLLDSVIGGEHSLRLPAERTDRRAAVQRFERYLNDLLGPSWT